MLKGMTFFKALPLNRILFSKERNAAIDVFRGVAILSVVLYHFNNTLPYGHIGVDLFFVISGLLIGGILTSYFKLNTPIHFFKFILSRGIRIWPSYYTFIIIGTILAHLMYRDLDPDQIITPLWPKFELDRDHEKLLVSN